MKQRGKIGGLLLHPTVAMILPGDFRKTKKPKARETVTWLPNQWVAAMA